MDGDKQPLLRLAAPRELKRKKVQARFPPPPPRKPAQHGLALLTGADAARQRVDTAAAISRDLATDVPYLRIQPENKHTVSDADLARLGLVPVMHRQDHVIAAYATDGRLGELKKKIGEYQRQTAKHDMLAKIAALGPWTRQDRQSPRFAELTIEPANTYIVDLTFLPMDGERVATGTRAAVARYVQASGGTVLDKIRSAGFEALRVRLGGQSLDQLLEYRDDVAFVDLPPQAHVTVPAVVSFALDDLPEPKQLADAAPQLCIIDSGLIEGHPLLEGAVIGARSKSYPETLGAPIPRGGTDAARHGTAVAGVALYGDLDRCVLSKNFEPAAALINARILDDHIALARERMPYIRDIVESLAKTCRIFNLSFGLEPAGSALSPYAADLDALVREHDAIIIVAAGNEHPERKYPRPSKRPPHPGHLLEDGLEVLRPAEALNVLTVGSITTHKDPHPLDPAIHVAAGKRTSSPFTRAGALQGVVKPDLVEEGGDLAIDWKLDRWTRNPGLRIPTTGPEYATGGKLFTYSDGTSIAAPKVAHHVARLMAAMPDASANLVRALLVNSASYPEGVQNYTKVQKLRLCGFGVPDLDRAMYCTDSRVTLYFTGEIEVDSVHLFEIPVPEELTTAKGRKRITVTVAYDPPVSALEQVRPAGINLTWKVAKANVADSVIEAAIAAEAEQELVDAGDKPKKKKVFEVGTLSRRPQQRGTVQKNVFDWSRNVPGNAWRLALTAKATRAAHANEKQRYAVVVTVEHTSAPIAVYQAIRARLPAGRVRVRVPVPR